MVGAVERIGVADVELFLAGFGLALGILHRDARRTSRLRIGRITYSSLVVWRMW
jgi:hypothetical protein